MNEFYDTELLYIDEVQELFDEIRSALQEFGAGDRDPIDAAATMAAARDKIQAMMLLSNDTCTPNQPWEKFDEAVRSAGFSLALDEEVSKRGLVESEERLRVWWRVDGVLVFACSSAEGTQSECSYVSCLWEPNPETDDESIKQLRSSIVSEGRVLFWPYPRSENPQPSEISFSAEFGLKHNLASLRKLGKFVTLESPRKFLLLASPEEVNKDSTHNLSLTQARLADVSAAVGVHLEACGL
jgi:hypothetical protein